MSDLVHRLRERARIRRAIDTRKSVQEGKPDRIADLLDEAATEIERLSIESWKARHGLVGVLPQETELDRLHVEINELCEQLRQAT